MARYRNPPPNLQNTFYTNVMGAVFALASNMTNVTAVRPEAVATGMHLTFTVAAVLALLALAVEVGSHLLLVRRPLPTSIV